MIAAAQPDFTRNPRAARDFISSEMSPELSPTLPGQGQISIAEKF
jgi:hypothetical protein